MRAYIFTDKALERYAGQFVWLSLNTEDSKNAAFLSKYPISALPTLLVLNSTGEKILMRYIGGTTVPQLAGLLDSISTKVQPGIDDLIASADQLASAGKHEEAAKLYKSALHKAPKGWRRYGSVAESLVYSLSEAKEFERCAAQALDLSPELKSTRSGAIVAQFGLDCAVSIDESNAGRADLLGKLATAIRKSLDDPVIDLAGDDRSGIYMSLIGAHEALKDQAGTQKLLQEWSAFLERAAREAKTAEQRAVYDAHRLTAYLELGTPEKAVPLLEQSERDFPNDYNPPARLALAYKAMREYEKAIAASERALARAYGPRRLTILRNLAGIYVAQDNKEMARKTFVDAIQYAKQLPRAQLSEKSIAALEGELGKLPSK
jgi:tetratricopeptide (TPR) repeat protein